MLRLDAGLHRASGGRVRVVRGGDHAGHVPRHVRLAVDPAHRRVVDQESDFGAEGAAGLRRQVPQQDRGLREGGVRAAGDAVGLGHLRLQARRGRPCPVAGLPAAGLGPLLPRAGLRRARARLPPDGGVPGAHAGRALISRLEADPGYLEEALQGLLPEPHPGNELPSWGDFARDVGSEGFADSCQICFLQGWEDESNDAVDPVGLFPAVRELMQSKELAVTLPQYSALFGFFDRDGVGSVSQTTFPDFVRYVAVMAYLGACRESGSGRPVDDAGAEDAEEQPCEEEVQRRLDETRAELEALGASALEPDATGAGGIDEERLKVQMDEELLARKRQELEELRARARAEEDALVAAQRPSGRGEVRHYEQDRAGAPGPQRKKGCLPACGRKQ
ncbi:unnamed protein product [Prorocentrum cordatum]|uniref:Calmodulin n=1 Tax=Prorocentrum cordatum TaxID=2364126 RepID=A0ABN9QRZ1_9DINO|nr:unnamed protein product [Polarella glacialis]